MIIFSVPKPFNREFGTIQENAIDSWLSIKPKPTIILLGKEEGVVEIIRRKNLIQIKNIKKNQQGTPLLNDIFTQVQKNNEEKIFMYINADIILLNSPTSTIDILTNKFDRFMAVGRRYEINRKIKIERKEIEQKIKTFHVRQKSNSWMDYFIFSQGIFNKIPPFAIGRTFWDKWLVWNVLQQNIPVIDISESLFAIHQTHSYSINNMTNIKTAWSGEEAYNNLRLAGGWSNSATIDDATYIIKKKRIYSQKRKKISIRPILDILPIFWTLFLYIRLIRERLSSIMNQKGG